MLPSLSARFAPPLSIEGGAVGYRYEIQEGLATSKSCSLEDARSSVGTVEYATAARVSRS